MKSERSFLNCGKVPHRIACDWLVLSQLNCLQHNIRLENYIWQFRLFLKEKYNFAVSVLSDLCSV